jgi:protein-arginine kinase activator protein McsA
VEQGSECAGCNTAFQKPNGVPALCRDCWSLARKNNQRKGYILTQYDDQDVHRGKIASRKRRGDA